MNGKGQDCSCPKYRFKDAFFAFLPSTTRFAESAYLKIWWWQSWNWILPIRHYRGRARQYQPYWQIAYR
jgi:hypothetical protein